MAFTFFSIKIDKHFKINNNTHYLHIFFYDNLNSLNFCQHCNQKFCFHTQ